MIKGVAFVAYPVSDVQRAATFYRDVIGLRPGDECSESWAEFDTGASVFAVCKEESIEAKPGSQSSAAFEVDDIVAARERLKARGVELTDLYEAPLCKSCFVTDPDGNRFVLHQRR